MKNCSTDPIFFNGMVLSPDFLSLFLLCRVSADETAEYIWGMWLNSAAQADW